MQSERKGYQHCQTKVTRNHTPFLLLLGDATIVDVSRLRGSYQIVVYNLNLLYMYGGKRGPFWVKRREKFDFCLFQVVIMHFTWM